MDLSAIFRAVPAPGPDGVPDGFSHLRVGDRLEGHVLRLEADGRVLIDLGRFRALAHTTMDVQPGQTLPLTVARTGMPIQLRLDTEPPAAAPRVLPRFAADPLLPATDRLQLAAVLERVLARGSLPMMRSLVPEASSGGREAPPSQGAVASGAVAEQAPAAAAEARAAQVVRQAFASLKALVAPWPEAPSTAQLSQWVRTVVEDRGVLFESRLADALEGLTGTRTAPLGPTAARFQGAPNVPDVRAGLEVPAQNPRIDGAPPLPEGRQGTDASPPAVRADAGMGDEARQGQVASPPSDTAALARVVQGIFFRDLKPQLLVLNAFLQGPDTPLAAALGVSEKDAAFVRQTVARLLSHVVSEQARVVQRSGPQDLFQVIAHMVPLKEGQPPVRLKVYYPKRSPGGQGPPGHRIALLLELDRLGPVRVDLAMVERNLRIQFFVRDDFVQALIDTNSTAVARTLEGPFDHVQVVTQVSRQAIERFDTEDTTAPALGRIDIQA